MKYALLSKQGTACPETVLTDKEYTPENRRRIEQWVEAQPLTDDSPICGTWTDVSENDAC